MSDLEEFKLELEKEHAAGADGMIVDMSRVRHVDQAAMLELMEVVRRLRKGGLRLSFFGLSTQAKKMIRVFGARDLFSVAKDEAEAAQILNSRPKEKPATSIERHQAARETALAAEVKGREINVSLPSDTGLVTTMRPFVHGAIREAGFSQKFADDIELLFDEAIHNVIEHTYGGEPNHNIRVRLVLQEDRVILELADDGETFDPTERPDIDMKEYLKEKRLGGLGVHLIKTLTDELTHSAGPAGKGNVLTMVKKAPVE